VPITAAEKKAKKSRPSSATTSAPVSPPKSKTASPKKSPPVQKSSPVQKSATYGVWTPETVRTPPSTNSPPASPKSRSPRKTPLIETDLEWIESDYLIIEIPNASRIPHVMGSAAKMLKMFKTRTNSEAKIVAIKDSKPRTDQKQWATYGIDAAKGKQIAHYLKKNKIIDCVVIRVKRSVFRVLAEFGVLFEHGTKYMFTKYFRGYYESVRMGISKDLGRVLVASFESSEPSTSESH
jgi:hypothetical protein